MRCSKQTIILTTCAIFVLAACWPMLNLTVMPNAAAQSGAPERPRTMKKGELFTELSRSRIESILAEPVPDVRILQIPLREVLVQLKELTGIDVYFDAEELGDVIDPDVPIDVSVAENSMTFGTLIGDIILGPLDLVYLIRDNHLVIMSYDKSLTQYEVVVYDCRDLITAMAADAAMGAGGRRSGTEGIDAAGGLSGAAGANDMTIVSDRAATERKLIEAIYSAVRSEDSPWDDGTGSLGDENVGTIAAINGLLIVRQTQAVHEHIERLLELLRRAMKDGDRSPATNLPAPVHKH